jgi:acyl-CoA reductase-like NAD-dependent aldehyde dehydrogenase
MDIQKKTVVICLAIYAGLAIVVSITSSAERLSGIGLVGLLLGVFYFVLGLVGCINKQSREVGKAILLSAGILLLIGVSVCSLFPFNFSR